MGLRYGLRAEIILGSELERKRGPWASGIEDGGRGHQPGSVGAPRSWKRPGARSPLEPQKELALPAPRVWPARPFSKSRGAMRHIRGVCRHRQARGRSSQHRGRVRLPRSGLRGAGGRDALRGVAPRGVDSWLLLPTMERGSQRLRGCQFSPSSRTCSVTDGALDPGVSRRASGAPPGQMGAYPTGRRPLDWGHDAGPLGIAPSLCGNGRGLLDAGAQVLCPV